MARGIISGAPSKMAAPRNVTQPILIIAASRRNIARRLSYCGGGSSRGSGIFARKAKPKRSFAQPIIALSAQPSIGRLSASRPEPNNNLSYVY